ncbi:MAG: HupE/UreJ family protein [Gallionella sp.]|nr:HupE/UreJ family protein [Gallionella sp.]MDD4959772.1 HupE/UreJ family protein [Gallionella sp.]
MKTLSNLTLPKLLLGLLIVIPNFAEAHVGIAAASGWAHGVLHPLLGVDHLCAMLAVGVWASQLGGRAVWGLPLTFVSVMALAGWLGMAGLPLPFVEGGIALSLLVLGVFITRAQRMSLWLSALMVGGFAVFHGYAHGAEMPQNASGLSYALGFIFTTSLLHVTGILLAQTLVKWGSPQGVRGLGALVALMSVYWVV